MARIMHVIHTGNPGGAENVLIALARKQKQDHEVIVGVVKEGWLSRRLGEEAIRTVLIPRNRGFDVTYIAHLVRVLKAEKIDLLHSHLLDTNFYASIAASIAGVPHLCTEHGEVNEFKERMPLKIKVKLATTARLSGAIVFVSAELMRNFTAHVTLRTDKAHVVRNGCEMQEPSEERRREARALLGIPDGAFVVGNVGSLLPVKGQRYLLEAIRSAKDRIPDILCVIAGRGPLEADLRALAADLGIGRHVLMLGYRDDARRLMPAMDAFALSSVSEGLPLALLEAMAASVPVVVTDIASMREIVADGKNGYLVPARDSRALAEALCRIHDGRKDASRVARAGFETVSAGYSADAMAESYQTLYAGLSTAFTKGAPAS